MAKDLRSYLKLLEEESPEEIIRIKEAVDPKYEMTAYAVELERRNRYPVLLFENAKGFDFPVVNNIYASQARLAKALDTNLDHIWEEYLRRESNRIPTKRVVSAPVREVITKGNEVDVTKFPIPTHFQQDAGPYIDAGIIVAKDPDTGVRNGSIHRIQLKGKDRLGVSIHNRRHLWDLQRRAEEKDEPLEIAVVLGYHPAFGLSGNWMGSVTDDHFEVAGGFLGEPVEVVKCETVDLEVPALAEIVIEGEILSKVREPEGPFSEYPGYLSHRSTRHVIKVKGITHRKGAIFQDIVPGDAAEHLSFPGHAPYTYRALKKVLPTLKAVNCPISGRHFHCYVSLKKVAQGQAYNAILTAFGADFTLKLVVVVDEDVDVFNETEVLAAVATRMQADEDLFVIPNTMTTILDPSAKGVREGTDAIGAKVGIDATRPLTGFPEKCSVSKPVLEKIKQLLNEIKIA